MLLHVFCCGFVSFIFYLFIYLFFAWCKREKKNSKLTINGLDLPLSTPTQPPPSPPPPPPSIHPSIHVLRVEPLEEFCHCIWKKVSFFCVFCHSWQFFLRIQFFSKSHRLALSFSLSCGVVLIYGSRSAQLKHLPVARLIKVDRLDLTHGAAALIEGHNSE